jgi:hypothetical protein
VPYRFRTDWPQRVGCNAVKTLALLWLPLFSTPTRLRDKYPPYYWLIDTFIDGRRILCCFCANESCRHASRKLHEP